MEGSSGNTGNTGKRQRHHYAADASAANNSAMMVQQAGASPMGYAGAYGAYGHAAAAAAAAAYAMSAAGYSYQQAAAYGYSAAAMAAYGGYAGQQYAASAGSAGYTPSDGTTRNESADEEGSGSLLDELKAKHSARASMREDLAKLRMQLAGCDRRDRKLYGALQQKIEEAEHRMRLMGERVPADGSPRDALSERQRRLRPPEDGRVDQFGRFCHVLAQFLRSCDDGSVPVARLAADRRVTQEWSDLERSRIVEQGTTLKDFLVERYSTFELFDDDRGQSCVRLLLEGSGRDSTASRDDDSGVGLRSDQVATIEAYLKKAGGSERVSRLETMFDVKKSQLARHFTFYEDRKRLYATPMPARNLAALGNTNTGGGAASSGQTSAELRQLDQLLQKLTPRRHSILEAMAFCLEHSVTHAAPMARGLIKALEEPGLRTDGALARFFLISDVLYNSNSSAKGAARYGATFQELLPDACERFGRQWFQRLERGRLEQTRAEGCVRKALAAWQDWGVFSELFVRGLEALLFKAVPDGDADADEERADEALKQKLATWRSAADAARLPYAARLRGLSGSALPTASCRARLCHYERYWHRPGTPGEEQLPVDDPWGERLRLASLGEAAAREAVSREPDTRGDCEPEVPIDEGEDGLDGLPLSAEESYELEQPNIFCTQGGTGPTLGEGLGCRVAEPCRGVWAVEADPYM